MAYLGSNPTSSPLTEAQLAFDVATQTELDIVYGTKQDTLVSGTNIKAINGQSLVGSGDLAVGIGVGQTWQDVTASRAENVTYTNTTGKAIVVSIAKNNTTGYEYFYINGSVVNTFGDSTSTGDVSSITTIVPDGSTYSVGGRGDLSAWYELR